jgi:hypothetical protein
MQRARIAFLNMENPFTAASAEAAVSGPASPTWKFRPSTEQAAAFHAVFRS